MDSEERAQEPSARPAAARPRGRTRPWYRRRWLARASTAVAFALAGLLAVTSSMTADGTDLRASRQTDLAGLVRENVVEKEKLEERAAELRSEVEELSLQVAGDEAHPAERKASKLGRRVGLDPASGPGLTVVLEDAPPEMRHQVTGRTNALVVHQQDIQAVANALWAAGAEAVTIQDQRIVVNSAIQCVGNSVVLHGVPYPPPYRISAVGDPEKMRAQLQKSAGVQRYLRDVERYQLGYEVQVEEKLKLPGFDGSIDLSYAHAD